MKFDVNKIITESITEAAGEVITEELEIMKGYYGNKLYDKLHPEKPDLAFETVKKLAKKNRELQNMGVGDHLAKAGEKAGEKVKEVAAEAKDAVVGAGKKAINATKDAATGAGQKVVDVAKNVVNDDKSVAGHLAKSFKKIKDDAQEGAVGIGHKVASHLGNLDYGNTALAAGGALAAGLGALALRKRLKKVK